MFFTVVLNQPSNCFLVVLELHLWLAGVTMAGGRATSISLPLIPRILTLSHSLFYDPLAFLWAFLLHSLCLTHHASCLYFSAPRGLCGICLKPIFITTVSLIAI